jgi:hypothetical protein
MTSKNKMHRQYQITELGPSSEGGHILAKVSYRVAIIEDGKSAVVEVRITDGTLETIPDSEKFIKEYLDARPFPQSNIVIDIP